MTSVDKAEQRYIAAVSARKIEIFPFHASRGEMIDHFISPRREVLFNFTGILFQYSAVPEEIFGAIWLGTDFLFECTLLLKAFVCREGRVSIWIALHSAKNSGAGHCQDIVLRSPEYREAVFSCQGISFIENSGVGASGKWTTLRHRNS
jgi:hypothetical protein